MAWIESHQTLRDHPKLKRLARRLEISEVQAIGHLHCLWWWAMDYAPDGDVSKYDELDLAIAGAWIADPEPFVQALKDCGWLDGERHEIHDWVEYTGRIQEKKAQNRQRQRQWRERNCDVTPRNALRNGDVTSTNSSRNADVTGYQTKPNQTKPDQTDLAPTSVDASGKNAPAKVAKEVTTPKPVTSDTEPAGEAPFELFAAVCGSLGVDLSSVSAATKSKQMAAAKRLLSSGMTSEAAATCAGWLMSQGWITSGVDLFTIEKFRDRWELAGKPVKAAAPVAKGTPIANPFTAARQQREATSASFDDAIDVEYAER